MLAATGTCENDLYAQSLVAFKKFHPGIDGEMASGNTSLFAFRGQVTAGASVTASTFQGSRACLGLDLNRSNVLQAGVVLSNAHQLNIQSTWASTQATALNYAVDVFMIYKVVLRAYNNQCVLEQ